MSSWQGNFQGEVQVSNTGTAALRGWTVTWTFANGQVISALWGGIRTQTGANVSVRNESWNGNLAAGAVANVGFLASQTGTNAVPTNVSCTPT